MKNYKIIENGLELDVEEYGDQVHYTYNGKPHRENGPTSIIENCQFYYKFGQRHRVDGPARVVPDANEYWYEGNAYYNVESDEEWKSFLAMRIFK